MKMSSKQSAHIIVLGDLSRSPRILSQARYLAQEGWDVSVSGYNATSVKSDNESLNLLSILPYPNLGNRFIPKLVLFGFKIEFAMNFFNEIHCNKIKHICVSEALRRDLKNYSIFATVYYDRAPNEFKPTHANDAHRLFMELGNRYTQLRDPSKRNRFTRFTEFTALPAKNAGPQWRPDRPALVVTSCSWTADDDFGIMLKALDLYELWALDSGYKLPKILFVVTGRGPMRNYYMNLVRNSNWKCVEVIDMWLDWSDYSTFLGCADLGISLHRSSSGLDLPMKVVDLLGVDVPVLALAYPTLDELLPGNEYGFKFETSAQLADQLGELLVPSSNPNPATCSGRFLAVGSDQLILFRQAIERRNDNLAKGSNYWKSVALPVYRKALEQVPVTNKEQPNKNE